MQGSKTQTHLILLEMYPSQQILLLPYWLKLTVIGYSSPIPRFPRQTWLPQVNSRKKWHPYMLCYTDCMSRSADLVAIWLSSCPQMIFFPGSAVCVFQRTEGGVLKTHAVSKVNCPVVKMSSVGNVECWKC